MERRKLPRILASSEITLCTIDRELVGIGGVEDISEGGILLAYFRREALAKVSTGTIVRFEFILPTGAIAGSAKIAWEDSSNQRLGLKFLTIDNEGGVSNLMNFLGS